MSNITVGRRKTARLRRQAARIRKANACATLQEIGDRIGVSREYVRRLLKAQSLETKGYVAHSEYYCMACGKITHRKLFCCDACRYEFYHPWVECTQCHKLFRRSVHDLIHTANHPKSVHAGYFCNDSCFGKYIVEHHLAKIPTQQKVKTLQEGLREWRKSRPSRTCCRCGFTWKPLVQTPVACPGCGSECWDRPRRDPVTCNRCGATWVPIIAHPKKCARCRCLLGKPRRDRLTCTRCGATWMPYVEKPKRCAVCSSPYWNVPRTRQRRPPKIKSEMS